MSSKYLLEKVTSIGKFRVIAVAFILIAFATVAATNNNRSNPQATIQIQQVTNCFPYGIDAIGAGDFDGGLAIWEGCLADDFSFAFSFGPGSPLIECPSPDCPIQEFSSRAELRALFAQVAFEASGYTATHHNLTNVNVDVNGRNAQVRAYITAWHVVPDAGFDLALTTYQTEVVREGREWKIQRELIEVVSFDRIETGSPFE